MALQTNLNKKDKMTIAILVFAALVFMIAWFLIKPTITSIITTDEKIEQAKQTQEEYRNKIIYLSSAESIYKKTVDDFNESTEDFYEIMDSAEIDRMVTSYVLKSGLFAENLKITMPDEAVKESPYIYSSISTKKTSSKNTTTASDPGAESLLAPYLSARNTNKSTQASGVQCVVLSLTVTGSRSACQSFIDDLCKKPAVRITGFTWSKVGTVEVFNEEKGRYERKESDKYRLRISVNLYMADVADYGAVVSESAS